MNPHEDRMARTIDFNRRSQAELSPALAKAYEKASAYVAKKAIHPRAFQGLYNEQMLKKDADKVAQLRERFARTENQDKKLAVIFEALFCDQAERNGWLGRDGQAIKTADYDDFINGVDLVAEFGAKTKAPSHLALAVDLAFGPAGVPDKLQKIRNEIRSGTPATVHYFISDQLGFKGELKNIPRAVLGVEHETLAELAQYWIADDLKKLHEHPAQRLIAEELSLQLASFGTLAQQTGRQDLASSYNRAQLFAHALIGEKSHLKIEEDDRVFRAIRSGI